MRTIQHNVEIRALGSLQVATGGNALDLGNRRVRRPLDLLRALVAAGPDGASRDDLCESVWELPRTSSYRSLVTTVYRLRRLLNDPAAVEFSSRRVALDAYRVWVDAWDFEASLATPPSSRSETLELLSLYRGALFEGQFAPYITAARQRLSGIYAAASLKVGAELVNDGALGAAQLHYERALQHDSRSEELFRALIEVLGMRGRGAAATITYNSCAVAMRRFHGRMPSGATRAAWESAAGLAGGEPGPGAGVSVAPPGATGQPVFA